MSFPLIYTSDFGLFGWNPEIWQPEGGKYKKETIYKYVKCLKDNGITTFSINPNTQVAWYPSRVWPTILDGYKRGDREYVKSTVWFATYDERDYMDLNVDFLNVFLDLAEQGIDWFEEAVKACHEYGISPWASIRMNDMHHVGGAQPGDYLSCPLFEDNRYRLKGVHHNLNGDYQKYFTGLNFGMPEVRDYFFKLICELIDDYPIEGLQIDLLRNPYFCEPPADAETIADITAWFAKIKEYMISRRPGMQLGMRIMPKLEMLKQMGVDIKALTAKGIVDNIVPQNFVFTLWDLPYDYLRRELGNSVKIYGGCEFGPNRLEACGQLETGNVLTSPRNTGSGSEFMRGNYLAHRALGVDGFEIYNFYAADEDRRFPGIRSDYSKLATVRSKEEAEAGTKCYTLSKMEGSCWLAGGEMTEQLPALLKPGWRRGFNIPMAAEKEVRKAVVQVICKKEEGISNIGLSINGRFPIFESYLSQDLLFACNILTRHKPGNIAFCFDIDVNAIIDGYNIFDVYYENTEQNAPILEIRSIEIAVY